MVLTVLKQTLFASFWKAEPNLKLMVNNFRIELSWNITVSLDWCNRRMFATIHQSLSRLLPGVAV